MTAAAAAPAAIVRVIAGEIQETAAIPVHAAHHETALHRFPLLRDTSMVNRSAGRPVSEAS